MRFDTKAKRFHKIKTPLVCPHEGGTSITVQKGSIHYYAMYNFCIELWKYIADEVIWSKVVTYQLLSNYDISGLCPLHLMSNGNMLMIDYRGGVRGFKNLNEIYENAREVEAGDLLLMEEEPRNYKEASTDEKWIEAMEIELDSINKNNTCALSLLHCQPDQKAIVTVYELGFCVLRPRGMQKDKIIQIQGQD
ncbi:hypothetical protein Tco_0345094 [Tanacetum coccineum]